MLAQQGKSEEAEQFYRRAIDAGDVDALNDLAVLLKEQGQTEEAEELYRRAIDSGNVDAPNNLAIRGAAQSEAELRVTSFADRERP